MEILIALVIIILGALGTIKVPKDFHYSYGFAVATILQITISCF